MNFVNEYMVGRARRARWGGAPNDYEQEHEQEQD
jgi:hypothetical protein